jgi:hypothetical protein
VSPPSSHPQPGRPTTGSTDGNTLAEAPRPPPATNSITDAAATLNSGVNWSDDDYFSTDLTLNAM